MISVICCSNNQKVYKTMLLASLQNQNASYEVVLIDNTNNKYSSAASALNDGARKANGEYLIFAHQDITFQDSDFLSNIVNYIDESGGIIGVAGIKDGSGVITNLTQGELNKPGGEINIDKPVNVQTLDEVLIAIHRDVFEKLWFDEELCDDWHLYGVDLCLCASKMGVGSYVIPDQIYHKSSGKLSYGYVKTFARLIRKHRRHFSMIYTTCAMSSTKKLRSTQYVFGLLWDHVVRKI